MTTGLCSKSGQGTGKSRLYLFLQYYVIGDLIMVITTDAGVLDGFNSIIENVILLVFEELPSSTAHQWLERSTKLKYYLTAEILTNKKICS